VAGVMCESLERAAVAGDNREPFMDSRLVLVSPYDPAAGFNVGHAMQRNKLIYALADAALVVSADFQKGGTWEGAIEQLERLRIVPVFVRNGDNAGKGNQALIKHGGRPWPEPHSGTELSQAIQAAVAAMAAEPRQDTLSFVVREAPSPPYGAKPAEAILAPTVSAALPAQPASPAMHLLSSVTQILLQELVEARTEGQVAELLGVSKPQAKAWLLELVKEGVLEKLTRPIRFRTAKPSDQLL